MDFTSVDYENDNWFADSVNKSLQYKIIEEIFNLKSHQNIENFDFQFEFGQVRFN